MKKFFIKICKLLGFEIIDQNRFVSPTLEKELNKDKFYCRMICLMKNTIILKIKSKTMIEKTNNQNEYLN